jgi:hypothetical protein
VSEISAKESAALAVGGMMSALNNLSIEGCVQLLEDPKMKDMERAVRAICDARARIFCPHDGLDQTTRRAVQGICSALDLRVAAELKEDVFHKGTSLALLYLLRETVRAVDPQLAEELQFPHTVDAAKSREGAGNEPPSSQAAKNTQEDYECQYLEAKALWLKNPTRENDVEMLVAMAQLKRHYPESEVLR